MRYDKQYYLHHSGTEWTVLLAQQHTKRYSLLKALSLWYSPLVASMRRIATKRCRNNQPGRISARWACGGCRCLQNTPTTNSIDAVGNICNFTVCTIPGTLALVGSHSRGIKPTRRGSIYFQQSLRGWARRC